MELLAAAGAPVDAGAFPVAAELLTVAFPCVDVVPFVGAAAFFDAEAFAGAFAPFAPPAADFAGADTLPDFAGAFAPFDATAGVFRPDAAFAAGFDFVAPAVFAPFVDLVSFAALVPFVALAPLAGVAAAPVAFLGVLLVALAFVPALFFAGAADAVVDFFTAFAAGFDAADFFAAGLLPVEADFLVFLAAIVVFLFL